MLSTSKVKESLFCFLLLKTKLKTKLKTLTTVLSLFFQPNKRLAQFNIDGALHICLPHVRGYLFEQFQGFWNLIKKSSQTYN